MSTHNMIARANLTLRPDVGLQEVWNAIESFRLRFDIKLEEDEVMPKAGEAPLARRDDSLWLEEGGKLYLNLACRAAHGHEPDELDGLCAGLDRLVLDCGSLNVIDQDCSAESEDSCYVRFIGATDAARARARLMHGLHLAQPWITDVLGPDGYSALAKIAQELAALRLAAWESQSAS